MMEQENTPVAMFGEEQEQQKTCMHPAAVAFHFTFRTLSVLAYLLCNWYSASYITNFVLIVALLSADFWTVKNVTGRILVGLRWWNYIDNDGNSHWIYEKRKASSPVRVSSYESRLFWAGLVVFPIIWALLMLVSLVTFGFKWLLVSTSGEVLTAANLYGYVKCKIGKSQSVTDAARGFFGQKMLQSVISSTATQMTSNIPGASGGQSA